MTYFCRSLILSPKFHKLCNIYGFQSISSSCLLSTMCSKIEHDSARKMFHVSTPNGDTAKLCYNLLPGGVLDFYHTEVPSEFRGQGIAKILAKAGLDYAIEKDAKILLSCSYMAKYVADNPLPEYTSRIKSDI